VDDIYKSLWFSVIGIVLILLLAYYSRRFLLKKTSSFMGSKNIKIVDRVMIGQDKYIMVIDIYNSKYIIAVSGQQITMLKDLGEISDNERGQEETAYPTAVFSNIFKEQLLQVKEKFIHKKE
jgi:flagellar biosynthetic protein FliO